MRFMDWIIEELWDIAEWFYDAYHIVKDWWSPFNLLATPLYAIYGRFKWLAEDFYDFREWLEWVLDLLGEILSWTYIKSLIRSWLYGIEAVIDWFLSWTYWVRQEIADWWSGILPYILDYIDSVVEGWEDFVTTWDTFWRTIYPTLVSFDWLGVWWNSRLLDVQDLIHTAILDIEGSLAGWQEVRDSVFEFFADPFQWVYNKLDEFFERFW